MTAMLMPGAPVADAVFADVAERVAKLAAAGKTVGLGTILVGDDPASAGYIAKKHEMCERYGLLSLHRDVPADGQPGRPARRRRPLQRRPGGRRLHRPEPGPGRLRLQPGHGWPSTRPRTPTGCTPSTWACWPWAPTAPRPCTPAGIQAMLAHYEVPVEGRHVVIVGRGPTLGRPLSLLLALKEPDANAAVTVVHTGVPGLGRATPGRPTSWSARPGCRA